MVVLVSKDSSIVDKLAHALDKSTGDLLNRDFKTIASEFLAEDRAIEQIELFKSEVNKFSNFDFKNKKLLEIGAGVGAFIVTAREKYNINAYGIEPSKDEFSPFFEISTLLLMENNLSHDIIVQGNAENLPFENNSFDLIYSTNVLEHVKNPKKVLEESIRVLKAGGFLQFVIPNYFSLWEGHYGVLWPCITNKFLARTYARLIGKNPKYIDTLQLISPMYLKKILSSVNNIEILDWGKTVFKKRVTTGSYTDWASLGKIRSLVTVAQKFKLALLVANLLNLCRMYTPIILTLRKK